jgi:hypothetical protein
MLNFLSKLCYVRIWPENHYLKTFLQFPSSLSRSYFALHHGFEIVSDRNSLAMELLERSEDTRP